jgi:hypothetical protein
MPKDEKRPPLVSPAETKQYGLFNVVIDDPLF